MIKKETKQLTVSIPLEIYNKIKEGGYNGNGLVNKLLKKYLEKNSK